MGILDKLGLKKKGEAKQIQPEAETVVEVEEKKVKTAAKAGLPSLAYRNLLRPILSEKATHLATSGKYVFAIHPRANKTEVKKSIQQVYGVEITSVKIIKIRGKTRRYGRTVGKTSNWKKALVTVRPGQKIPGIIEAVG